MTGWRLNFWSAALVSLLVCGGLVFLLAWRPEQGRSGPLKVYCASALQQPVEEIAKEYEKLYQVPIRLEYGASQNLVAGIEISKIGDLYIPADDSYIDLARSKGLLDETMELAHMHPVIVVRKGNPKKIKTIDDVLKPNVVFAQADPDHAAVGKVTRDYFRKTGQWEALDRQTKSYQGNIQLVANAVAVGTVDAGIVWDATVAQMPELEAVKIPGFSDRSARVTAGVLKTSERPTAALRFARYLSARDKGLQVFVRRGFAPAEGDEWADSPKLLFFGGAMLLPAVDETIQSFAIREGVQIKTVYNGCGLLLSQMRVGEKPDAYLACDVSFLDPVRDRFGPSVELSRNKIVILVEKGNPKNIKTLEDLARPGLALGLAHEEKSTLGSLTRRILEGAGLYDRVVKNRQTEAPTADFLVNQMRVGALDAAIVYASNASGAKPHLDTVPIDLSSAIAIQPFAVGRDSRYPNLMKRLLAALRSEESKQQFEKRDFLWGPVER